MPTNYDAIYAWTSEVFGGESFTPDQFRDTFQSPDAKKVLSDFRRLGYVDRVARGIYRVTPPDERVRRIVAGSEARLGVPEESSLPYAYSEATAVAIWTDGAYWTGFTRGLRPLHLNVRRRDVRSWKGVLAAHGFDSVVPGERKTLCGTVFVLHPMAKVDSVRHAGVQVVSLRDAHRFAADHPYAFDPVIRALSERLRRQRHGGASE